MIPCEYFWRGAWRPASARNTPAGWLVLFSSPTGRRYTKRLRDDPDRIRFPP